MCVWGKDGGRKPILFFLAAPSCPSTPFSSRTLLGFASLRTTVLTFGLGNADKKPRERTPSWHPGTGFQTDTAAIQEFVVCVTSLCSSLCSAASAPPPPPPTPSATDPFSAWVLGGKSRTVFYHPSSSLSPRSCRQTGRPGRPQHWRGQTGNIILGQLPTVARMPGQSPEQRAGKPRLLAPLQSPSKHAKPARLSSTFLQYSVKPFPQSQKTPSLVPHAPQIDSFSGVEMPVIHDPATLASPSLVPSPDHAGQGPGTRSRSSHRGTVVAGTPEPSLSKPPWGLRLPMLMVLGNPP